MVSSLDQEIIHKSFQLTWENNHNLQFYVTTGAQRSDLSLPNADEQRNRRYEVLGEERDKQQRQTNGNNTFLSTQSSL